MNYKLLSAITSIFLTVFLIFKNSLSFNPIRFHCPNYILNTYLYLALSIAIFMTTILSVVELKIDIAQLYTGPFRFLFLLLSIVLILAIVIVPPKYFMTKHLIWLIYLGLLGLIFYPIYQSHTETFMHSGVSAIVIVLLLTSIAYLKPELISLSWDKVLLLLTIVLLITNIVERVLVSKNIIHQNKHSKLLSYISIGLFSLWILLDTKRVIVNAKNCVNPDYINESLNLVLDSMNIFSNLINIKE